MNKFLYFILIIILLGVLVPHKGDAAVSSWWQKGASINPRWNTDFESDSFRQSVRNLHSTGADFVTLIIPLFQSNNYSTDIGNHWNTPADQSLISAINFIHSLGMKVDLKPHLEAGWSEWRAHINPSDRETWFRNYGNKLEHYAKIGQSHGVEQITIGTELISMSTARMHPTNTENWIKLINRIKEVYSGKLTYSANSGVEEFVNEKANIEFWPHLDSIGLSAYLPFNSDESVESIKREWDRWNNEQIKPLQQRFGKPVIFTELGYRSRDGARFEPWNSGIYTSPDQTEQANLYEALFSYWNGQDFMTGISLWDWSSDPNAGGNDQSYTPQNKMALEVLKRWFGNSITPTPTLAPNPTNPTFNINGSLTQTTISVNITNTSQFVNGAITDIEIYNSSGQKIFQKFYENQNFGANETKTYSDSWSLPGPDSYTLKAGIFNSAWQLYQWSNNISEFRAGDSQPAANSQVDIWWPTNGPTVSGIQPFKAMLQNWDISQYKMFWQVDGDRLNEMFNNSEEYPHKEVVVDLSGWTWKPASESYELNFIAQNLGGDVLNQKKINIHVSR